MTEEEREKIIEHMVLVAADRVDSLIGRPDFQDIPLNKALKRLKQSIFAAMLETEHLKYEIKTRANKRSLYVNIKLFEDTPEDFDIQLRYAINSETT